jgi:glycosyltransferase involved in cell wall biosynthesis/tetratricopeptide (TPR) repeat protein
MSRNDWKKVATQYDFFETRSGRFRFLVDVVKAYERMYPAKFRFYLREFKNLKQVMKPRGYTDAKGRQVWSDNIPTEPLLFVQRWIPKFGSDTNWPGDMNMLKKAWEDFVCTAASNTRRSGKEERVSRRNRRNKNKSTRKRKPLMSKADLKEAIETIEAEAEVNIPISVTMITRNDPEGLKKCLLSVKQVLLTNGDEICVLDTGSDPENLEKGRQVVESLGGNFHHRDLMHDFSSEVKEWIPEWEETFKESSLSKGCLLSFANARQVCSDLAEHPIQFWIDTDDVLVEEMPGQLRWLINQLFGPGLNGKKGDSLFMEYKYAFDESDGSCITTLKRERVVDTRKYKWVGRCHETLIPKGEAWEAIEGAAFFKDLKTYIVHQKNLKENRATDVRNYLILRKEIEDCKAGGLPTDPRTTFYLGNACRGLSRDVEAIEFYEQLYSVSGSLDDRYLAIYYCGMIWLNDRNRRPLDALDCFHKCMRLRPTDPRSYFGISRCYYALGRFREALQYFRQGINMPPLEVNLHADDPQHSELLPYQIAAMSARELGQRDMAAQCAEKMAQKYPNHKLTKQVIGCIQNDEAKSRLIDGVMRIVANEVGPDRQASAEEVKERIRYHFDKLEGIPDDLEKQGMAPLEPDRDIDPEKEVIFYCGGSVEEFGPKSTGLGGSEKMVVKMASALQEKGFQVSVYCACPRAQRGVDKETGVFWWHWGGLNTKKLRGTVIYWRSPELLKLPIAASKRILWCHDVQEPRRWSDTHVALVDQVWVLSEFHATTLGPYREKLGKKVRITRNGLDLNLYAKLRDRERDPNKIVFASSPDRGVLTAIRTFQYAKRNPQLPQYRGMEDAKLHIYYGFNKLFLDHNARAEYRHLPDVGRDVNGWEYMQDVLKAVDEDDDIIWHGRVDWETMAEAQATAGVWLYPTRFPEISCMAAMEAQAAGCNIVATDYAALAETIAWDSPCTFKLKEPGDIVKNARILAAAVRAGKDDPMQQSASKLLAEAALVRFGFGGLADDWAKMINE